MTFSAEPRALDPLVEAVAGAWRPRDPRGTIRFHPGWYDLDDKGRVESHDAACASRAIEAAWTVELERRMARPALTSLLLHPEDATERLARRGARLHPAEPSVKRPTPGGGRP